MEKETVISKNILENMSDGVMTIDLKGEIITFNPAAAQILGLRREDVLGKKFAEVFLEHEGNDAFNQAILDAIYESLISHNRTVDFNTGDKIIALSLTTSFLQSTDEGGSVNKVGVIALFSDITEVKQLQDAQARLAEEVKGKHKELQNAYLKIEESNKDLGSALKKVQMVRIAATAFTILLFLGIGFLTWNRKYSTGSRPTAAAVQKEKVSSIFRVTPQPVSSLISVTGNMDPLNIVNITSPLTGRVKKINFNYGEIVRAGQVLLSMDTSEVEVRYREANAAYIKASENFKSLQNWDGSTDVARARRSHTKAKLTMESQKKTLEETERLFKKGIVPASEYEGAKQQYVNQQLDLQSAQEEVQAAIAKGNEENKKVARLEMENAHTKMKELEEQLRLSVITAPVPGVVILPIAGAEGKEGKTMERGSSLQQGEIVLSIGDLTGFSVKARVDEVDVVKIKEGQKVNVSGDAFPGMKLPGKIRTVSSQSKKNSGTGGAPSFEFIVAIDDITPEQRKRILVGMSVNLEVLIYERPDALMVPISAVKTEGEKRFVLRRTGGGPKAASERAEVRTGYTTLDSVEITGGLKAGDEIEI